MVLLCFSLDIPAESTMQVKTPALNDFSKRSAEAKGAMRKRLYPKLKPSEIASEILIYLKDGGERDLEEIAKAIGVREKLEELLGYLVELEMVERVEQLYRVAEFGRRIAELAQEGSTPQSL